ncbi:MAG: HNH endonuclease signature motif containing protein [Melioribacteraceae bacterium]|nr:HNH endonuclease signature motif containing protein [Melioribacteraceae bacterium]
MISFLRKNWCKKTNRELAQALGLKLHTVRMKLYELGLKRMELEYWTDEQVNFLKENYKVIGDVEMAEIFNKKWHKNKGWTFKHIEKKRNQLDFHRTERQIFKIVLRNIDQGRMDNCNWAHSKLRKQLRIGTVIVRTLNGYKVKLVRVKGGFKKLAHINYEKVYGPIPEGMLVTMKDGDPLNCEPENLLLITRKEQAERIHESDRTIAFYLSTTKTKSVKGAARKNEVLFNELLKHPEILEFKRSEIKLRRAIRNVA